ncbi:MAG: hypothetical protein ACK5P5_11245 [Pseudobdellovibrionaceae bacterium]
MGILKYKTVIFSFFLGLGLGFLLRGVSSSPDDFADVADSSIKREDIKTEAKVLSPGTFPPPQYSKNLPEILETQPPGELKVSWEKTPGASRTRVKIYDSEGKFLGSNSFVGDFGYVKKITWKSGAVPHVFYKIELVSLNDEGVEGPPSEQRRVKVHRKYFVAQGVSRDEINLSAPEIKSIQLEDDDN